MESEYELETIAQLAEETGFQPKVAVRVNPDFELKSSGMKMGGGSKQFGIDAECVPAVLQRIAQLRFDFEGLHIFSGSQNLRVEALREAHEKHCNWVYNLLLPHPYLFVPSISEAGLAYLISPVRARWT